MIFRSDISNHVDSDVDHRRTGRRDLFGLYFRLLNQQRTLLVYEIYSSAFDNVHDSESCSVQLDEFRIPTPNNFTYGSILHVCLRLIYIPSLNFRYFVLLQLHRNNHIASEGRAILPAFKDMLKIPD